MAEELTLSPPRQTSIAFRLWLAVEFGFLFVAVPVGFVVLMYQGIRPPLIPTLCVVALGCSLYLVFAPSYDRRNFLGLQALRGGLPSVAGLFGLAAILIAIAVYIFEPDRFLSMPLRRPQMWLVIMIFYPLLSVFPQGVIYRAFLFQRYRALFPTRSAIIAASTIAFGFGHIIFLNPIAITMTLIGGFLFARTYHDRRSLALSSLEHALYGCLVFTIGLGHYFFTGAVRLP